MTTTKDKLEFALRLLREAAPALREYRRDQLESQGYEANAENTADSVAVEIETFLSEAEK